MKWVIKDWRSNIKFWGQEFDSFEEAEECLTSFFEREKMDYEEWRQEYFIEEV